MGYAFTLALCNLLFPDVPTGAYVHYPTISTDMLGSLDEGGHGVNAGAGSGWKGVAKRHYWHLFARMYSWVGGNVDVVMTNSSWTQAHIRSLWGPSRAQRKKAFEVQVVFPPVAVSELEQQIEVSAASEEQREPVLLYIAQFRPEKDHTLILRSFAEYLPVSANPQTKLVLIGSVRHSDDATRVYKLRLLAHELKIKDHVVFICDASWPEILDWLRRSSVGVNGMWNEHFGIGVVEYQAAGLVSVVHDSGGPKQDIVVEYDGGPTGAPSSYGDTLFPQILTGAMYSYRLPCKHFERLRLRLCNGSQLVEGRDACDAETRAVISQTLHRGGLCRAVDHTDGTLGPAPD